MREQVLTTSVATETAASMTTTDYLNLTYPEDSTINCSSRNLISSSPIVNYKPIATDNYTLVTCSPPPGFRFPEGTSIVICTVNSKGSCSFNITVDTIPPNITCTDIRSEDETPEWTIPDATDDNLVKPVTCTDEPNETYEVGSANEVTCTAKDSAGNIQNCSFLILIQTDLSGEIEQLTQNITKENVEVIANQLEDITESNEDLEPVEFVEITIGLAAITAVNSTNSNVTESVVNTVDNLMDFLNDNGNDNDFEEAIRLILDSLEDQIGTVAGDGQNYTQEAENLGIQTQNFDSEVLLTDVVFSVAKSNKTNVCLESDCQTEKSNLYIMLPKATQVNISFVVYRTDVLFPWERRGDSASMSTSGSVLSATIYGKTLMEERPKPVEISFTVPSNLNRATATCVFWDKTVNDWLTKGCSVSENDDGHVTCRCTHLTNFAVLMFPNKIENIVLETFLDIVTYIGCGISIVCLCITIFTILRARTIRSRQPQKIMVNFCISLTCLYTVFILGVDQAKPGTGECKFIAALIHYFLLTSIAWTLVEAINMYFLFIKVFNTPGNKFIWIAIASSWGVPLVIVVLLSIISQEFYGSKQYCYINSEKSALLAIFVIIPISLIMFCNFIMFGMVIKKLFLQSMPVGKISKKSVNKKRKRVVNAIAISFLLGLTWAFGFISFEHEAKLPFLILFCLFNSFQGVAIFYLFCLRQKECIDAWRPLYGRLKGYVQNGPRRTKAQPHSIATVSVGLSDISESKTDQSNKETNSLSMDPF